MKEGYSGVAAKRMGEGKFAYHGRTTGGVVVKEMRMELAK